MKKNGKLKLHRETLRILNDQGLRRIAGGGGMDTTNACEEASWCACETEPWCSGNTWDHTCGTVCDIPTWHC